MKKEFNTYLDEVCRENKKKKIRKKEIFNNNIKSHIVYMDENGKIYKKKQQENKRFDENKIFPLKILLYSAIFALLIYIIYELVPLFVLLTN